MKVHQLDVAIPLHLKSQLKKGPPLGGGEGESESGDTMPFVMLTRKGNKQQVRVHLVRMNFCCLYLYFILNVRLQWPLLREMTYDTAQRYLVC